MLRSDEILTLASSLAAILFVGATAFMPPEVYSSGWWFGFWAVVAAAIVFAILRKRLWRKPAVFSLHLAFLLILGGGAATALFAERGSIHLHKGQTKHSFVAPDGLIKNLPVAITLDSFEPEYYPGMSFPRDFHSRIHTADGRQIHISMNRIGKIDGWRFYQSSFDAQGGSVLLVSHDPWGIGLTYAGYALFALAGLPLLFRGRTRKFSVLTILLSCSGLANAAPAVPDSLALSLEEKTVRFRGQAVPYAEMADALTRKLTGRSSVGPLNASRFVASLSVYPQEWARVPFLQVKSRKLAVALRAVDGYVAPAALYDSCGAYIPQKLFGESQSLDSEILKLDEKVAVLSELWQNSLYSPAENALSPAETRLHMLWTSIKPWKCYFMLCFALAFIGLLPRAGRAAYTAAAAIGSVIFAWNWIMVSHAPLSCSPEIMCFTAIVLSALAAIFARKNSIVAFIVMLMAGCVALVGWLGLKDPMLTPLMPVLASPWLAAHVSLVMIAYAILGSTFAIALAALLRPASASRLAALSLRLLMPGTYILALGIFLGAMWANVSWGRYWAWDPKETWALVTLLVYALPLHPSAGLKRSPRLFHAYMAAAILSILMTYLGVNYLPSLHAYA